MGSKKCLKFFQLFLSNHQMLGYTLAWSKICYYSPGYSLWRNKQMVKAQCSGRDKAGVTIFLPLKFGEFVSPHLPIAGQWVLLGIDSYHLIGIFWMFEFPNWPDSYRRRWGSAMVWFQKKIYATKNKGDGVRVKVTIVMMKHHNQSTFGKKELALPHLHSSVKEVRTGT